MSNGYQHGKQITCTYRPTICVSSDVCFRVISTYDSPSFIPQGGDLPRVSHYSYSLTFVVSNCIHSYLLKIPRHLMTVRVSVGGGAISGDNFTASCSKGEQGILDPHLVRTREFLRNPAHLPVLVNSSPKLYSQKSPSRVVLCSLDSLSGYHHLAIAQ